MKTTAIILLATEIILMIILRFTVLRFINIRIGKIHWSFKNTYFNRIRVTSVKNLLRGLLSITGFIAGWFMYTTVAHFSIDVLLIFLTSILLIAWFTVLSGRIDDELRRNRNGRIYTFDTLKEAVDKFNKELENGNATGFYGEIDHPTNERRNK